MESITSRDVYVLLSFIPNIIGKAYVTHIFSSGMSKKEALDLDIQSLINACDSAFRDSEEKSLENLLLKEPDYIIPMWQIDTTHGKKITFSSSESLFYLFIYLKERFIKNGRIDLDEKLFVTGDNVLSAKELNDIFKFSDKRYVNNKIVNNKIFSLGVDADNQLSELHFSSKDLTKNFETICDKHLPLFADNEEKIREYAQKGNHNIKRRKLQQLFCKGLPENDKYFKAFTNDIHSLEKYYSMLLPYLTAKNYLQVSQVWESAEYQYLWDKIHNNALKQYEKRYSEDELNHKLDAYLKYRCDFEPTDELINIFKDLAIAENDYGHFKDTPEHLDKLMRDAIITDYVLNLDFETRYINKNLLAKEKLIEELDDLGVFDKFNIDKEIFFSNLEDYLSYNQKYNKKRNLSKMGLAEVLIESRR